MKNLKYSLKCAGISCCAFMATLLYAQKPDSGQDIPSLRLDDPQQQAPIQYLPGQTPVNATQPLQIPAMQQQGVQSAEAEAAAKAAEEAKLEAKRQYFSSLYPPIAAVTDKLGVPFWERYWIFMALFALLAAILLWLLLKPRRAAPKTPYEIAMARLALAPIAYDKGGAKAYAHAVSQAVRDYIEQVHNIPAPERTTEEFLQIALDSDKFDAAQNGRLSEILNLSDMAKFALHSFQDGEMHKLLNTSTEFIEADKRVADESEKAKAPLADSKNTPPAGNPENKPE